MLKSRTRSSFAFTQAVRKWAILVTHHEMRWTPPSFPTFINHCKWQTWSAQYVHIYFFPYLSVSETCFASNRASWLDIFVKHKYWSWRWDSRVLVFFSWRDSKTSIVWMRLSYFFDTAWLLSMAVCWYVVDGCSVCLSKNLHLFGSDNKK